MSKYKKITFGLVILQIVLFLIVIVFFEVDNMTLGQGEVYSFDTGWTVTYPDGTTEEIGTLPYHSVCKAGDVLVAEKPDPGRILRGNHVFPLGR